MGRIALLTLGVLVWVSGPSAAAEPAKKADQPAPMRKPEGAREVTNERGELTGWEVGLESNAITIVPSGLDKLRSGAAYAPTAITHDFKRRSLTTVAEWEKYRAEIRQRILGFLAKLPPRDLPLDARIEPPKPQQDQAKAEGETGRGVHKKFPPYKDTEDLEVRLVSLAFSKERRGRLCLVIPKGLPAPAPAVIMYGAFGNGIEQMTEGVYSRAYAVHLARLGLVVAVLDHWYDEFGKSGEGETIPLGASIHTGFRALDYLLTQKGLVHPRRIAVVGHVYGAEIAPFLAGLDDRVAACVTSCSSDEVITDSMAYWGGPSWMGGSRGLGAVRRYQPYMFIGTRRYDLGVSHGESGVSAPTLPFLSQEYRALVAPRPFLSIQEDVHFMEAVLPVYELYGKADAVACITHKWKTNLPVNAQEFMLDFLLERMCGIQPGKPPEPIVKQILANLGSKDAARQAQAARLAGWWKCKQAVKELDGLLGSKDAAVRRAAAKALGRAGAVKQLLKHLKHADPVVRLAAVESLQLHGDQDAFHALARGPADKDRWVGEATFQTLEINPEEW